MSKKNLTFTKLMKNPLEKEMAEVWYDTQVLAKKFNDMDYPREAVLKGIIDAALDMALFRMDEKTLQNLNERRAIYYYAMNQAKLRIEKMPSQIAQENLEKIYGKDLVKVRNVNRYRKPEKADTLTSNAENSE